MTLSDDFGFDNDDTAFIAVATQVEASQHGGFGASRRPTKRRRLKERPRTDGASSDGLEWSETDDEGHSPAKVSIQTQTQDQDGDNNGPEQDNGYYFPGELDPNDVPKRNSKYKIHRPINGGQFEDQIFTQTQVGLDSNPSQFRGAVWKKPKSPPPAPILASKAPNGLMTNMSGPKRITAPNSRQTTLNGLTVRPNGSRAQDSFQCDAEFAARLQAQEDAVARQHSKRKQAQPLLDDRASFDVSLELADLPSDAFSSSSPEKSPEKDAIVIQSQATQAQQPLRGLRAPQQGLKQMTIFGQPATQDLSASQAAKKKHAWPLKSREELPTHHKLDEKAMETCVYPTNLGTVRDYQYNIVSRSLYHNTLVALPTGLGKTFIAATVMLNYYRWTKDAQIVFMAPTKPLIAQQLDACYGIVGIPRRDTVLMTGETTPALRAEEWLERRVFFMTPQTVINDLKTGICDPKKIVLVVVDEAHKATGGYAYTEVINFMRRFNNSFRVQALTATPGSTTEAVQAVIDNLGIARVELRTEQSLDIRQYTHEKHTDTEEFDFSDEQVLIMELFSAAIKPVLEKLCSQNAYWSRDPMALSAYGLTNARQKWMGSEAGRKAAMPIKGMMNSIFTVLSSLAHGVGLLKHHGIGPFYSVVMEFQKNVDSGQSKGKYATQIAQSEPFTTMMRTIRGWTNNPDFIGHPKLEYLREIVLNHFLDAGEGAQGPDVPPSATRIMVFASYRDSTEEICRVLKRNEPMIRPHVFVGQAASKGSEGMDQKKQNAVIQDFKSGKYNTLVATSIGEEGLDIGTVDLIICYDASSSPIRMLQRIGRTGRKRVGRVVLLLTKGKEVQDYAKAQDNYLYIQKTIADASKYNYHDDQSPRILPRAVQPVVDKRVIEIPVENTQTIDLNEKKRKAKGKGKAKRPPKKFHMPDGVRTGFVKASKMDDDDSDDASEDATVSKKKKTPAKKKGPASKATAKPDPEPDPVQMPYLGDVLLNESQQRDLERKYAEAADDEGDCIIKAPDLTRFPEMLRQPGVTKYVSHGKASSRVAETLRAIREVDNEKVKRMKEILDMDDLNNAHEGNWRLVSPRIEYEESEEEVLEVEVSKSKAKKPTPARPKRKQPIQRTASARSAATANTDADDDNESGAAAKKPRARAKKKVQRATSYGSAAAEGVESSPEPTPAEMRIGTQGIDLGTMDTSGEDEDEEPDSELEEFVVRSDQPIEMASSSQRLPDDTQPPKRTQKRGRAPSLQVIESESDKSDDIGLDDLLSVQDDNESIVEEVSAPTAQAPKSKKRRAIVGSDSDE